MGDPRRELALLASREGLARSNASRRDLLQAHECGQGKAFSEVVRASFKLRTRRGSYINTFLRNNFFLTKCLLSRSEDTQQFFVFVGDGRCGPEVGAIGSALLSLCDQSILRALRRQRPRTSAMKLRIAIESKDDPKSAISDPHTS